MIELSTNKEMSASLRSSTWRESQTVKLSQLDPLPNARRALDTERAESGTCLSNQDTRRRLVSRWQAQLLYEPAT